MKITYIYENKILTNKASTYQIFKNIDSMINLGHEVILIYGNRFEEEIDINYDLIKKKYLIKNIPKFLKIQKIDFSYLSYKLFKTFFFQKFLSFLDYFLFILKIKKFTRSSDLIYMRNIYLYLIFSFFLSQEEKNKIILEIHNKINLSNILKKSFRHLFSKIRVVFISKGLKLKFIEDRFIINKSIIAHDAVDLRFVSKDSNIKRTKNKKLNILYLGNFYINNISKGVDDFIEYLSLLNKIDFQFIKKNFFFNFIGSDLKTKQKLDILKEKYDLDFVSIGTFVDMNEYDNIYNNSDAFLIPNPINDLHNLSSPLKLFQYISKKKPILSTRLDCVQEILGNDCYYFDYENISTLINSLHNLLLNKINFEKKYQEVIKVHNWDQRVKNILNL